MAGKWVIRVLLGSGAVLAGADAPGTAARSAAVADAGGQSLRGAAKAALPLEGRQASAPAAAAASPPKFCKVGEHVECPGSGRVCSGDQCCPGIPETQNKTFPCPSAPLGSGKCASRVKVGNCVPCLCIFDVDRTLTGKQGDLRQCPGNLELPITDWAYGGGNLTLSPVGRSLRSTFCAMYGCFVGVVTAGDASGYRGMERAELEDRLGAYGGLPSTEWSGPSRHREGRTNCSGWPVNGTLVAGCDDGTKQFAVAAVVAWLERTQNVELPPGSVWHYDDKAGNVLPFRGTGFNAREISCASRDGNKGLCGAVGSEIADRLGVASCPSP